VALKIENKSIMVTGGAGFIGSHLVDRLIQEKPSNLVVVDNFVLGKETNLKLAKESYPQLKIYHQDASDYEAMKQIMKDEDIQVVFNLAVTPLPASLTRPKWAYEVNMAIVLCLLELIRSHDFDTLIHFSSSEAYGTSLYAPMDENHPLNGLTPYAVSKAAGDRLILSYCHLFGIDAAILRPFNNYGPRQNDGSYAGVIPLTIKRILSSEPPIIYGDGKQTRDYLYVTETADAAIKVYNCTKTRGRVLNIGSGKETSINMVVQLIAQYLNCNKPIVYQEPRPGDVRRHIASIFLAEELIDFYPKVNMEEGMKLTVEWYKKGFANKAFESMSL
jgi:UDP-glucose 4-epimerase